MKNSTQILGHSAPAARMTKSAAFLLAAGLSVPVFTVLMLLDLLLF